jgi:hypothetical protein
MNTNKIAGLYPYFLDGLRTCAAQPHRSLLDMLEIKLRCELLVPSAPARRYWVALRDQDNPQQRFDQLGLPTNEVLHEQVTARVWNWAQVQLLALPASTDVELLLGPSMGWWARARAFTAMEGQPGQPVPPASEHETDVHVERQASATDLAPLLRGLRAYQAKRRKRARRLLAQLWTYHSQQLVARQYEAVEAKAAATEGRVAA